MCRYIPRVKRGALHGCPKTLDHTRSDIFFHINARDSLYWSLLRN